MAVNTLRFCNLQFVRGSGMTMMIEDILIFLNTFSRMAAVIFRYFKRRSGMFMTNEEMTIFEFVF